MGSGFLNQLGRFLPNTGTIMAPRISESADVKVNKKTDQNKLLILGVFQTKNFASQLYYKNEPVRYN